MPGTIRSNPGLARLVLVARGDRLQNILDPAVGFLRTADHDRRAVSRAFFSARNAHTDETRAGGSKRVQASARIVEIRIAGIDNDVIRLQERLQGFDLLI